MKTNKLIVILGPTASGKTDLAIKLARKFNGEIVCADSRQVYKEMAIGTASPTLRPALQPPGGCKVYNPLGVVHYLFNFREPNKPLNVATYKKMAEKAIKNIQKRGKIPFLVGGTGLYIKSVVDNLQFPKLKPSQKLRNELEQKTVPQLFVIYKKLDPQGAVQIDKNNKRRLIRAIEVCKITGQPFWTQRKKQTPLFDVLQIGINPAKDEMEKRIAKRTEAMFKQGLEKEVKTLVKKYGWASVLQNTIGYSEWQELWKELSYFQKSSSVPLARISKLISLHTLQFAKRQMSWFKKDKRILWIKNYTQAQKSVNKFISQT
ncbi:MAG: tRNA (adenosine(37)-N6)-dimethylallyltransferase MiaA [Candidatus Pacebacteria bacterium]|nr:tRNA (adenosine(37)-N6)-dimethylallyltransferase MiaA [Candidatus Paceibacterota bacterium]